MSIANIENTITFIIPTVGRNTLSKSVESLLNQTDPNWKCIIIFDGIPIQPILDVNGEAYSMLFDPRFNLIRTKKLGNVNTENHNLRIGGSAGLVRDEAIKICNTEWIGFLDDDDCLNKTYVELLYNKYVDYDLVVWRAIWNSPKYKGQILPPLGSTKLERAMVGIHFCYKKSKFPHILFNNNDGGEDFYFLQKIVKNTNNYIIANDIVYNVNG